MNAVHASAQVLAERMAQRTGLSLGKPDSPRLLGLDCEFLSMSSLPGVELLAPAPVPEEFPGAFLSFVVVALPEKVFLCAASASFSSVAISSASSFMSPASG